MLAVSECSDSTQTTLFPLFRQKFLAAASWTRSDMNAAPSQALTSPSFARPKLPNLLDLKALPRDDGPPSETQLRRQKYLFFEKHCSQVADGLYVSGDTVAKNRELLRENGISHVINCVGFICKEYFKEELQYKTLFLQDTPAEDILCVLYDCFDFIDSALQQNGRVLVHCSQGVSRSATVAIAYLMWRQNKPYDEVFAQVKSARGVANPNIGFTCQLLQWQKRRQSAAAKIRMYRIAPHCPQAPAYLVPKIVTPPKKYPNNTYRELDPRGTFIIQTPYHTFIWQGARSPPSYTEAAQRHAVLLQRYEGGPSEPQLVVQGQEPELFKQLMDPHVLDPEQERINARRASITGEILMMSSGAAGLLAGAQSVDAAMESPSSHGDTVSSDPMAVDTPRMSDLPSTPFSSPPQLYPLQQQQQQGTGSVSRVPQLGLGSSSGSTGATGRTLPPVTPYGTGAAVPPDIAAAMAVVAAAAAAAADPMDNSDMQPSPNTQWSPSEVEEYSEDYMMYPGYGAGGSGFGGGHGAGLPGSRTETGSVGPSGVRMSYDTLLCLNSEGLAAAGIRPMLSSQFNDRPANRPSSPGNIDGRIKKYRRSESDRLGLNLHEVQAGMMGGGSGGGAGESASGPIPHPGPSNLGALGGGLSQRRGWPSLHTSIDEEDMLPDLP